MPMIGQPTMATHSISFDTLRPNISPTDPPNTVWSWLNTPTGRPSERNVQRHPLRGYRRLPRERLRCRDQEHRKGEGDEEALHRDECW